MSSKKPLKQPSIGKITQQLSKLKHELRMVKNSKSKSMINISNHPYPKSYGSNLKQNLRKTRNVFNRSPQFTTEGRKRPENDWDMSICKESLARNSQSESNSRSKSKSSRSKFKQSKNMIALHNKHSKHSQQQPFQETASELHLKTQVKNNKGITKGQNEFSFIDISASHDGRETERYPENFEIGSSRRELQVELKEKDCRVNVGDYCMELNSFDVALFNGDSNLNDDAPRLKLRVDVELNKLKKCLLRFPNFSLSSITGLTKTQVLQLNQKTERLCRDRYVNYLQSIENQINKTVNFVNECLAREMKRSFRKRQSEKENYNAGNNLPIDCMPSVNKNQLKESEMLKGKYLQEKQHKRQLRRKVKQLQEDLTSKEKDIEELQFRLMVAIQTEKSNKSDELGMMELMKAENQQLQQESQTQKLIIAENDRQMGLLNGEVQVFQVENKKLLQNLTKVRQQLTLKESELIEKNAEVRHYRGKIEKVAEQEKKQEQTLTNLKNRFSQKETQVEQIERKLQSSQNVNESLKNTALKLKQQLELTERAMAEFEQEKRELENKIESYHQRKKADEYAYNQKIQELFSANQCFEISLKKKQQQLSEIQQHLKQLQSRTSDIEETKEKLETITQLYAKCKQNFAQLFVQSQSLKSALQTVQEELTKATNENQQLNGALENYKDRCLKAEVALKEQQYLQNVRNAQQVVKAEEAQKQKQKGFRQIQDLITSHKEKLQPGSANSEQSV